MKEKTPDRAITNIDIFAACNFLLFLWMCYAAYFERFINYRGREYLWEFFVYAMAIMAVILFAWRVARRFSLPSGLLILAQLGIVMHFAGGLAIFHESRLYDKIIYGIRYDKYVHVVNALLAGCFALRIPLRKALQRPWFCDLLVLVIVLGLGAAVEIVEYLVTLTVKNNGVGDYDNNMQDLISNFIGVSLCVVGSRIHRRLKLRRTDLNKNLFKDAA